MKAYYSYRMFDYRVHSDIQLDYEEEEYAECDLKFVKEKYCCELEFQDEDQWDVQIHPEEVVIRIDQVGSFYIEQHVIRFVPVENYDQRAVLLYFTGIVIGTYLLMQHRFALHGSVIQIGDGAVVFCGESGAGKSSISQGLIQKGYRMLSDDIALIKKDEQYHVVPSFPTQKLWEDTAGYFSVPTNQEKKTCREDEKFNITIQEQFCDKTLPLYGVVVLEVSEEDLSMEQLSQAERLNMLIDHSYLRYMCQDLELDKEHFRYMVDLSAKVPVYRLNRTKGIQSVEEQIKLVLQNL